MVEKVKFDTKAPSGDGRTYENYHKGYRKKNKKKIDSKRKIYNKRYYESRKAAQLRVKSESVTKSVTS